MSENTLENIIREELVRYQKEHPAEPDMEYAGEDDYRSMSDRLRDGFLQWGFDLNEFLTDYVIQNSDFRNKVQELVEYHAE